jgi:hypothetical protein
VDLRVWEGKARCVCLSLWSQEGLRYLGGIDLGTSHSRVRGGGLGDLGTTKVLNSGLQL